MESKGKNSTSQQAEQAAALPEHSRVNSKKAWDIKSNTPSETEKEKNRKTFHCIGTETLELHFKYSRLGVSHRHF